MEKKLILAIVLAILGVAMFGAALLWLEPQINPTLSFISDRTSHAVDYYLKPQNVSIRLTKSSQKVEIEDNQHNSFAITGETYYDYFTRALKNWSQVPESDDVYVAVPPSGCVSVFIRFKADSADKSLDTIDCLSNESEYTTIN